MKNLRLAHPKKMDVAVPANLKCGRPETDPDIAADPISVILREAGFSDVANLAGGMLRWRAEGHTVEGGSA
jgi:hypothetical protein